MNFEGFRLSCEDVQDEDDWRLRVKGGNQLMQVDLEMAIKWCECCVWMNE